MHRNKERKTVERYKFLSIFKQETVINFGKNDMTLDHKYLNQNIPREIIGFFCVFKITEQVRFGGKSVRLLSVRQDGSERTTEPNPGSVYHYLKAPIKMRHLNCQK
jgi:hypothetical protein